MTNNFVVVLSCGTDNPNRATRAVQMAAAAHKEGKNVTVFLLDEGVYLARKGVAEHLRAATGDAFDDHLAYLQAQEVPIIVCSPCALIRQVTKEDLIDCARLGTAPELINLCCDAAVLSL